MSAPGHELNQTPAWAYTLRRIDQTRLTYAEVIVVTMRHCGKTYQQIADELGFTRQNAELTFRNAAKKIMKGGDTT